MRFSGETRRMLRRELVGSSRSGSFRRKKGRKKKLIRRRKGGLIFHKRKSSLEKEPDRRKIVTAIKRGHLAQACLCEETLQGRDAQRKRRGK